MIETLPNMSTKILKKLLYLSESSPEKIWLNEVFTAPLWYTGFYFMYFYELCLYLTWSYQEGIIFQVTKLTNCFTPNGPKLWRICSML